MKKIIIKEEQLKLIENLILENKVQEVLSTVESGDIILVYSEASNKPSKFEVMNKLPDGIFMRVADKNSKDRDKLIQFSLSDLTSDTLDLKFTKRPEGEDNPEDIKWNKLTIKGVTSISVTSEDKTPKGTAKLDAEAEDEEAEDKENDEDLNDDGQVDQSDKYYKESLISLVAELNQMVKGVQYVFKLSDNSEIYMTVLDKDSKVTKLNLDKTEGGGEAQRYDELINDDLTFEPSITTVKPITGKLDKDGNPQFMFDMVLDRSTSDGVNEAKSDAITINSIIDFDEADPVSKLSDEEVLSTILSKPEVRSAFAKEPSLWDLITKKDPIGIFKAKHIFRKVFDREESTSLNDLFKMHQTVKFELTDNYFYKELDGAKYTLNLGKKYTGKVSDKGSKGVLLKAGPLRIRLYRLIDKKENIYRGVVIIPQKDKDDFSQKRTIKIYKQV